MLLLVGEREPKEERGEGGGEEGVGIFFLLLLPTRGEEAGEALGRTEEDGGTEETGGKGEVEGEDLEGAEERGVEGGELARCRVTTGECETFLVLSSFLGWSRDLVFLGGDGSEGSVSVSGPSKNMTSSISGGAGGRWGGGGEGGSDLTGDKLEAGGGPLCLVATLLGFCFLGRCLLAWGGSLHATGAALRVFSGEGGETLCSVVVVLGFCFLGCRLTLESGGSWKSRAFEAATRDRVEDIMFSGRGMEGEGGGVGVGTSLPRLVRFLSSRDSDSGIG